METAPTAPLAVALQRLDGVVDLFDLVVDLLGALDLRVEALNPREDVDHGDSRSARDCGRKQQKADEEDGDLLSHGRVLSRVLSRRGPEPGGPGREVSGL